MARGQYFMQWPVDDYEASNIRYNIQSNKELDIFISCVGGSVNAGFAIANLIQAANAAGKDIKTHILSNADSIASVVFLSAPPEKRSIVQGSTMFIHEPRFMFAMDVDQKKAKKIDEDLEVQKNRMADFYVKQIDGLNKEEALALMAGEKNLTADFMLEKGIVNEVKDVLDIAAQRGNSNLNNYKMGLFSKKTVVNQVTSGDNTFLHEGELAVGCELTQVGTAEAKLEGEHVIADGRTLVLDTDNKVAEIKEAVVASGDDSAIVAAVAEMIGNLETKMTAMVDSKIEAIRKGGSTHKPEKSPGADAKVDVPTGQSVRDFKAEIAAQIKKNQIQ